jgi:hypothetical protein
MNDSIAIPKDRIEAFCRKWGVREFSFFGSVLGADFGPESDVDVLVELDPARGNSVWDWMDMITELRAIFGRDVDLVEKDSIRNPFRRREILSTYKVIYAG